MTLNYEKRIVPAREALVLVSIRCDLCQREMQCHGGGEHDWSESFHDVAEVFVEFKAGSNYGTDGGETKTTAFHICPACFTTKLAPWLGSQGAVPTITETDW